MKTLDKVERQVLIRKYMANSLTFEKAVERVNIFHNKLKKMRDKLKLKGKTEEDMNTKFKKEFYELCQRLEN